MSETAAAATPPASEPVEAEMPAAANADVKPTLANLQGTGSDSGSAAATPAPATPASADSVKVKSEVKKGGSGSTASKIDLQKAPVRQYLDVTVVPALLAALSAVARERPEKPITFLGDFLHNFAKQNSNEMATD